MSTVRSVCTKALRRLGIVSAVDTPSAEDAVAALDSLNDMVFGWAADGVDVLLQAAYALDDEFVFWVPPVSLESDTIGAVAYQGTWNASTNSPSLTSATGTEGYVYKVSTAGSTTLDDVTSWSLNDYAVYDGSEWLKGIGNRRFEETVVALLVMRLSGVYSAPVPDDIAMVAQRGWGTLQGYYVTPPLAQFDKGIIDVPSRSLAVDWGQEY